MSRVDDRLAELGIELPDVVPPLAAYVPAVRSGDLVWTSGQLPLVKGELAGWGAVGQEIDADKGAELARLCAINAIAAIKSEIGDLDKVVRVVKVVGYVCSARGFTGQPAVVNGASHLLGDVFGDAGKHARSAVGVAALPLGAPVEVEVVVQVSE
jgi:enamine deaminase RidA (YjgF/YER057c/UK114 family)